MEKREQAALSKQLSLALRHQPWIYELELDEEGWVPLEDVLIALRKERPQWRALARRDVETMIAQSAKTRHEISGDRIRAVYGHSVEGKLKKEAAPPPVQLFHGTSPETLPLIIKAGLKPMSRQYVHLSLTQDVALEVGRRKAKAPTLLTVRAADAHNSGVLFYEGNDLVWLADEVPAQFIDGLN